MNINRQEARILGELLAMDLSEQHMFPNNPQTHKRFDDEKELKEDLKNRLLDYANEGVTNYIYSIDDDNEIRFVSKEELIDFKYNLANMYDIHNELNGDLARIFKKRRVNKETYNPYDPETKQDDEFLSKLSTQLFCFLFQEEYYIQYSAFDELLTCIKPLEKDYMDFSYKHNSNYRKYFNFLRNLIDMLETGKIWHKDLELKEELV